MKSFIWLQCADGSIQQVEEEVAMFCPMIYREILQTGMGSSKNYAISLPERVNPAILSLIFDYCRFHQVPGRSNKVFVILFLFLLATPNFPFSVTKYISHKKAFNNGYTSQIFDFTYISLLNHKSDNWP